MRVLVLAAVLALAGCQTPLAPVAAVAHPPGPRLSTAEARAVTQADMARTGYMQPPDINDAAWRAQQRMNAECAYEASAFAGTAGYLTPIAQRNQLYAMCVQARQE